MRTQTLQIDGSIRREDGGRWAVFSACEQYRYVLGRSLGHSGWSRCVFVMLNPSTADELHDDPTIRKCIKLACSWGHDSLRVVNLFAYRSADPRALRDVACPSGPLNGSYLADELTHARRIVCAWGNGGGLKIDSAVQRFLAWVRSGENPPQLCHLGITAHGQPKHPLARGLHHIPADVRPIPWEVA